MRTRFVFAAVGLLGCVAVAQAQTMKPGLWEVNQKMQGAAGGVDMSAKMAAMQEQMAKMPPEQRKMMEDMMAKNGVSMGAGSGGGMAIKMCITKEMAERNEVATRQQGDCTSTHSPRTGNSMQFSFTCTKPPSSGEGTVTFTSSTEYSMAMTMKSQAEGRAGTMTMNSTSKWLGDDCGSVKPIAMPKK